VRTLLAAVAVGLVVTAAASARNPRLEHLALRPADMDVARNAILRTGDLGSGWTQRPAHPNPNAPPDCAFQDYSAFTITGRAQARFARDGALVVSRVEVYPTHGQVLGDFAVDARPRTAACEGEAVREQFAQQTGGGEVHLLSARQRAAPKVGQRATSMRIVLRLGSGAGSLKLWVDLIGFVRDRAVASVVVVSPGAAPTGTAGLARRVDARLQRAA
jgi:hypothetical protein